jgi:hypothetical protein
MWGVPPVPEVPKDSPPGVVGEALDRRVRVGHEDQRRVADLADRGEVLERVERQPGEHMRVDHHRAVEGQREGVAVRGGVLDEGHADVAGCARLVVHDDLLAEAAAEELGDHPRTGVRHAARREGHDQPDRPRRPGILRGGRQRGQAQRGRGQRARGEPAAAAHAPGGKGGHGHPCLLVVDLAAARTRTGQVSACRRSKAQTSSKPIKVVSSLKGISGTGRPAEEPCCLICA